MSMDEPTRTEMVGITKGACTSSALQMCPDFIEKLPVAMYACDMHGRIVWFNARAVALWGRTPRTDDDVERFCEAYWFGGRQVTPEETPMSAVLKTGIPIHGVEGLVDRPDGSRVWTMAHIEPVKDENGRIVGKTLHCILCPAMAPSCGLTPKSSRSSEYSPDEYIGRNIAEFHVDQTAIVDNA